MDLLIFIIFIIATPAVILAIAVLTLTCRLVATRHDKAENAEPWTDRLYSAAKRATLSWCAVTAFAVVAYGVFGFWDIWYLTGWEQFFILCSIPAAAFAWGMARPRIYRDGLERNRNGRYGACVVLSFLMFLVFAPTFAIMRTILPFRTDSYRDGWPMEITSGEWSSRRFRLAQPVASALIPREARDIELRYTPPVIGNLGGEAEMRCRVAKDDLLAFAKAHKYTFQSKSVERNFCENGCGDCDFVWNVWHKYNGNAPYPPDFLAYNYRFATCGGFSFLYDVTNTTLYAEWSSN